MIDDTTTQHEENGSSTGANPSERGATAQSPRRLPTLGGGADNEVPNIAASVSQRVFPLEVRPFSRAVKAHLAQRLREEYEACRRGKDWNYAVDSKRHGTGFWMRVLKELMGLDVNPIDYIHWLMARYAHPPWPSGLLVPDLQQQYARHYFASKRDAELQQERLWVQLQMEALALEVLPLGEAKRDTGAVLREMKDDLPALLVWCAAVAKGMGDLELEIRPKLSPFVLNPIQRSVYGSEFPKQIAILRVMLSAKKVIDGVPPFLSTKPLFPATSPRNAMESGTAPTGETGELQEGGGVGV